MNPVVHFEMPAVDRERMAAFYPKVFGWTTQQLGPEMDNYVVVQTTETEEDDIRDAMKRVTAGGGRVLGGQKPGEPDRIPGVGLYAAFIDTEGNRVGILQPSGMTGASE